MLVLGGNCQEGDEGSVLETEMENGGVGRKVSRGVMRGQ